MNNDICVKGVEDNQIDDDIFIKCRFGINFQYRVRVWFGSGVNPKFNEMGYCCADYENIKSEKFIGYYFCKSTEGA